MTTEHKYGSFQARLIASFIDAALFWVILIVALQPAASAQSLASVLYYILIFIMVLISPLVLVYQIIFLQLFGATIGKLLCGLVVKNIDGSPIRIKQIFFRQTIGYAFSWLFFGLGYLAIFKSEKKQAWHDSVVGTVVMERSSLWPLGLGVFFCLIGGIGYLGMQTFQTATRNQTVITETGAVISNFQELLRKTPKEATPSAEISKYYDKDTGLPILTEEISSAQRKTYALIDEKKYQEASASAVQMLKNSHNDLERALSYQVQGEVFLSQEKFSEAKAPLLESFKYSTMMPFVYEALAQVSIYEKDYLSAKAQAQRATEFEKPTASSFYWLGLSYYYLEDGKNAVKNMEKAIAMDPENEYYKQELEIVKERLTY